MYLYESDVRNRILVCQFAQPESHEISAFGVSPRRMSHLSQLGFYQPRNDSCKNVMRHTKSIKLQC